MTDEDLEGTIGEFVELEDELTTGGAIAGTYDEGTVSGGTKVAVEDVPDGYPAAFDTDHALRLDVRTDDGSALSAYLPWPEPGSEADAVPRLLDTLGLAPDEFADIYGERVALEPVEGWHRVDVDGTAAVRDDAGGASGSGASGSLGSASTESVGDFAGAPDGATGAGSHSLSWLVPAAAVATGGGWYLAGVGGAVQTLAVLAWGLSLVAIPAGLFYDAHVTGASGGWDPNPFVWGGLGVPPVLNVPVGVAYLLERFARSRSPTRRGPSRTWFWGVAGATVLAALPPLLLLVVGPGSVAGEGSLDLYATTSTGAWIHSVVLLPLALYFDAKHVEAGDGWDPLKSVWVGLGALSAVFFSGWVVGAVYLLWRHVKLP